MDIIFLPHNAHLEDPDNFPSLDPHLRQLRRQPLIHRSYLLDRLPFNTPGIYTLGGGRQIGKTTLMKQWMAALLDHGIDPKTIVYLTGELLDDHHTMVRVISSLLEDMPEGEANYLILDEVTYIRDWDKGIKYMADAGMLERTCLFLTGSDLAVIREARMRFPGRRGLQSTVDFHLYPLNFFETVQLKQLLSPDRLNSILDEETRPEVEILERLNEAFEQYLIHGGFLTAINDMARDNRILPATFAVYSDWIRGDFMKRNRQEHYLREILDAVVKRYGSQITWNVLAKDLSIDHPKTVADYLALLASMDALFVQQALLENKRAGAPKKARKVMFTDPFILHAVRAWLEPSKDPYIRQAVPLLSDPEWAGKMAEAVLVTQYRQYYPTYYIKSEGEVDLAYIDRNRFWPMEVKWTAQLRPKDLKQIRGYPNGRILTKSPQFGSIGDVPAEPLSLALFRLGAGERPGV